MDGTSSRHLAAGPASCDGKARPPPCASHGEGARAAGFGYARGLRSWQRSLGASLLAAAAVTAPWAANATTDTVVRLAYQADEQSGCASEDELRRMVTNQLGHDPFRPDADQRLAISIARTESGFQGRIVWTEPDGRAVGERLLISRSRGCEEIAANVAFAVALQLQLVERGAANDAGPVPSDEPPAVTTAPTIEHTTPPAGGPAASGEAAPDRLRLAVGAGPALGLGMTPQATGFARLFVVARFRRWSAEIAGDAALPVTQEEDGAGVVVNAIGSSAAGCAHVSVASACVLVRLGWIRGRGTGVGLPSTSWGHFTELGARLAGSRELGRFILSVHADGLVMLSRWNVVLNEAVFWRVPRLGVVAGVDVALLFF